jgi:hypothetical protein
MLLTKEGSGRQKNGGLSVSATVEFDWTWGKIQLCSHHDFQMLS